MSFQSTNSAHTHKIFQQSPTCGFPTSVDTQCITDSLLPGWMKEDNVGKAASVRRGMLGDKTEEGGKQDGA